MERKLDPRPSLKTASIARKSKGKADPADRLPDALRQDLLPIMSSLVEPEEASFRGAAKHWCHVFQAHGLALPDALSFILSEPSLSPLKDRLVVLVSQEWVTELEKGWQRLLEEQTHALHQVNHQLRMVDRSRAEFVSTLSHELRTPLTAIYGSLELLMEDFHLPPEQFEYLRLIRHSAEHVHRLIEDILDFSKLEAGKLELDLETVDLQLLMEGVFELVTPMLREKHLEFSQHCEELPMILADSIRLRQILLNLLSNAIKFTPEGGHLEVRTERTEAFDKQGKKRPMLAIEVIDDGIGIAPEHQAEIFERFRQVKNRRSSQRGTGLGLPISRFLVELHGGSIDVKSQPGEGSTFRFTIPLAP